MDKIAKALVNAQRDFSPALKTNTNPHFKSKYVGLDGCVEAVIDALNDNGIFLMQQNHECSDGVIVETIFIHESGQTMSAGKLHVPAAKNDPQGYGSALTYARRYSLMAACGIAPEDDDGNAASRPVQKVIPIKQEAKAEVITPEQAAQIRNVLAQAGLQDSDFKTQNGIDNIPKAAFSSALKKAQEMALDVMEA